VVNLQGGKPAGWCNHTGKRKRAATPHGSPSRRPD
jgi:hypothetical protein